MLMGIEIPEGQGNTIFFLLVLTLIRNYLKKLKKKLKMLKVFFHQQDQSLKHEEN